MADGGMSSPFIFFDAFAFSEMPSSLKGVGYMVMSPNPFRAALPLRRQITWK